MDQRRQTSAWIFQVRALIRTWEFAEYESGTLHVRAGLLDYYGCLASDAVRCLSAKLRFVACRNTEVCSTDTAVKRRESLNNVLRFENFSYIIRTSVVVVMAAATTTTTTTTTIIIIVRTTTTTVCSPFSVCLHHMGSVHLFEKYWPCKDFEG
jgi:hypothetical protein